MRDTKGEIVQETSGVPQPEAPFFPRRDQQKANKVHVCTFCQRIFRTEIYGSTFETCCSERCQAEWSRRQELKRSKRRTV